MSSKQKAKVSLGGVELKGVSDLTFGQVDYTKPPAPQTLPEMPEIQCDVFIDEWSEHVEEFATILMPTNKLTTPYTRKGYTMGWEVWGGWCMVENTYIRDVNKDPILISGKLRPLQWLLLGWRFII